MKIKDRMLFAHMRSATAYSLASYAVRLKVGCVIVDPVSDRPVAIGWNGTAPGKPNVCEKEIDGQLVSVDVIHAEDNALLRLKGEDHRGLVMFVTHSPCRGCAGLISASGKVATVYYNTPYRDTSGILLLLNKGIEVYRMVDQYAVLKHEINKEGELVSFPVCLNPDKI